MRLRRSVNYFFLRVGEALTVLKVLVADPINVGATLYRVEQASLYFSRVAALLASLHS